MLDLNPRFSNNPVEKLDEKFIGRSDWGFARLNQNHGNYRPRFNGGSVGGVQFRLETMEEDSGVCSPPLWQSPPRPLSPSSRAQAIARGQREIMEMVENMPETLYELSLKDIVEQRRDIAEETQSMEEGEEERSILASSQSWKKSVKRQGSIQKGRIIVKNGSNNQNKGLLINMFFPISFGSKQRKSSSISSSFGHSAKFSPKPELLDKSSKSGDWWWKRFTVTSDSDSLGISSGSSTTTGRSGSSGSSTSAGSLRIDSVRKNKGCSHGCWSFFPSRKKKNVKLRK